MKFPQFDHLLSTVAFSNGAQQMENLGGAYNVIGLAHVAVRPSVLVTVKRYLIIIIEHNQYCIQ